MAIRAYFDEPVAVVLPCLTGFPERLERAFRRPKADGERPKLCRLLSCSCARRKCRGLRALTGETTGAVERFQRRVWLLWRSPRVLHSSHPLFRTPPILLLPPLTTPIHLSLPLFLRLSQATLSPPSDNSSAAASHPHQSHAPTEAAQQHLIVLVATRLSASSSHTSCCSRAS